LGAGAADPDDAAGMMRQKRARGLYSPCRHREAGIRAGIARHSDDRRGHLSRKRPLAGLTMTAMGQNGWSWHIVSQKVTVSLGGYPRGYITEPQQSSFPPSARPRIYPRICSWAYSWTYPRVYPWARCDPNCFRCGPGETTRLHEGDLRPQKPQSLHAPRRQRHCRQRLFRHRFCGRHATARLRRHATTVTIDRHHEV